MKYYNIHTHKESNDPKVQEIVNILFKKESQVPDIKENKFYSLGVHPWYIPETTIWPQIIKEMEGLLNRPEIIAIGECGIDTLATPSIEKQIQLFRLQIGLSETLKKPVIIHCVKAWNEIIDLHNKLKPSQPWIIHGFRGKPQLAESLLKHGLHISVNMHCPQKLPEVMTSNHILVETDDSKVTIQDVYTQISNIWKIKPEILKEQICKNFRQIFQCK